MSLDLKYDPPTVQTIVTQRSSWLTGMRFCFVPSAQQCAEAKGNSATTAMVESSTSVLKPYTRLPCSSVRDGGMYRGAYAYRRIGRYIRTTNHPSTPLLQAWLAWQCHKTLTIRNHISSTLTDCPRYVQCRRSISWSNVSSTDSGSGGSRPLYFVSSLRT